MAKKGLRVGYALCPDPEEVAGVNSREELARLEARWNGQGGPENKD